MQKITDNVYVETGFRGCNPGFVVTREGVVMIDTPWYPVDAVKWRDEINKYGEIRYLINTEPHDDHFTGNYLFGGTVVGHEGTREAILSASVEQLKKHIKETDPHCISLLKGFHCCPPTITLSQRLTLYLGNHTFHLIHMPGHTPFQVVVYIPEERVVFTGDNVVCRIQAWLHEAVPYQWLDSLKRLQDLEVDVMVPGHGSICDRSYIPEMRAFIQDWIDAVTEAIDRGMSLKEAQDSISFLNRYPMGAGAESMGHQVQRRNVAHLYEALSK